MRLCCIVCTLSQPGDPQSKSSDEGIYLIFRIFKLMNGVISSELKLHRLNKCILLNIKILQNMRSVTDFLKQIFFKGIVLKVFLKSDS